MSTELINLNEATRRLMKAVRLIDTSDEVVSELSGKISDIASEAEKPVSYTHLTLPTTPYE